MEKTALILEDSTTQALIISRMIEAHGWTTQHFSEVREASEALTQMQVHALFLDVFVNQHNTLLHIDRFRKLAPNAPMVLMTAGSRHEAIDDTLRNARKTGAEHVLRKPFTDALLANVLASLSQDAEAGSVRKHVLVIDDSRTVRLIAAKALESGGYRVSQAGSMEEAFADVDIAHVDLVLCDVFMPGMGGLKGMRMIKSTWPRVSLISMSGGLEDKVTDQDALNATRKFGVDAQIKKPFEAQDLLDVAELVLGNAA
ncbi:MULTISPECIES: response regulator [Asticcacaulis]|uniref:response regulator n=1 Tax=Asticcacaulis TaxID=76890 RepID=UPI001AE6B4B0|nr:MULTISPECIES: response regulator [Asticcacaulis]MBP2159315.1 CheY-like chemotaxis protein [Asticcacaulis solisilvae]MDR6800360.1 CheY-like chemotaxis protein [Asticcacaulis sp. BE141]